MPSSVIRFYFYDAKRAELTIVFQTGRQYIYRDVPPEIYEAMQRAESLGEYFNANVKDHYRFTKKK